MTAHHRPSGQFPTCRYGSLPRSAPVCVLTPMSWRRRGRQPLQCRNPAHYKYASPVFWPQRDRCYRHRRRTARSPRRGAWPPSPARSSGRSCSTRHLRPARHPAFHLQCGIDRRRNRHQPRWPLLVHKRYCRKPDR
ncbi:hypothetical protein YPPY94_1539 [Yersinia pestis PY-94]|nr:hypothetical protein YPPY15_1516 [Yersinia pestis PY-15]EIR91767.1 hypothetical protein YPPY36_1704 [Yersinia pestis PY-36]EIT18466.1 hypothetical protein YPPY92_1586 [Yersinia pestis PY-92]EIT19206.1 hypothetical protein YPPY94_1539 [Yersinia pestis PY-94]EIT29780.1 hypothetical protein YPPY95_1571 [Yersinia pestis PY-95]EIT42462.1 hypothetical protein YPPY99_1655 [Yersinia pestis PY-99]